VNHEENAAEAIKDQYDQMMFEALRLEANGDIVGARLTRLEAQAMMTGYGLLQFERVISRVVSKMEEVR
jgi:hypothetical protein